MLKIDYDLWFHSFIMLYNYFCFALKTRKYFFCILFNSFYSFIIWFWLQICFGLFNIGVSVDVPIPQYSVLSIIITYSSIQWVIGKIAVSYRLINLFPNFFCCQQIIWELKAAQGGEGCACFLWSMKPSSDN